MSMPEGLLQVIRASVLDMAAGSKGCSRSARLPRWQQQLQRRARCSRAYVRMMMVPHLRSCGAATCVPAGLGAGLWITLCPHASVYLSMQ